MSDVKRYYVGVNTKCLGGIGLVEMTDLYREATGFDGLVMGKDYDALKAENESLRKDAEKWKIVENTMERLQADEQDASIWSVCSRILISTAHKINAATSTVTEEGVTSDGVEIGDWRVTVERISSPENPS